MSGIFAATGQTCIAGSRLLLQESIHDAFVDKLLALAKTARMGDPMSLETQVGPVTTRPQYEKVLSYIDVAKNEGAQLRLGGGPATRPECGKGWFVEPTIFTGVDNHMRIAQEEVFGPVLSVIPFKDEDDAVRIANDVRFGLGAGVWTQRHRPRDPHVGAHPGRHGVGEHLPRGELHVAVRRLQGHGMGRENGAERDLRVPADQERVDQHRGEDRQSVRHALKAPSLPLSLSPWPSPAPLPAPLQQVEREEKSKEREIEINAITSPRCSLVSPRHLNSSPSPIQTGN